MVMRLITVAAFACLGCGGKPKGGQKDPHDSSLYRLSALAEGDVRPKEWAWFVSDQGTKLLTADDFLTILDSSGTPVHLELQCSDAERELRRIGENVAAKKVEDPNPDAKYFHLIPVTASFVSLVQDYDVLKAAAKGGFSAAKITTTVSSNNADVKLLLASIVATIVASSEFEKCVTTSLENSGKSGTFEHFDKLLIGDGVLLSFDARVTSGGLSVQTLVDADVSVDFQSAELTYFQIGRTIDLDTNAVLGMLRSPSPNPTGAISLVQKASDGHGYLASKRKTVESGKK